MVTSAYARLGPIRGELPGARGQSSAVADMLRNRSSCSQWRAMRVLPRAVSATLVLGFLPTNRFTILTKPASSSLLRWLDRLPLVNPVVRCRKTKSAESAEERTVMIARRPGSWISRSSASSSLTSDTAVLQLDAGQRAEGPHQRLVVEPAGN